MNALIGDPDVPDGVVGRVHDGWVWLVGEADARQRAAAERAVEHIPGIKGVTNLVHPTRSAIVPELAIDVTARRNTG